MRQASWVALLAVFLLHGAGPSEAQSSKARIAVFTPGATYEPLFRGLREGLAQHGYREGEEIVFVVEETGSDSLDLASRAARLVEARPDVLFTITTSHTAAAKRMTATIPVVFTAVGDPVRSGFVASYASSKNNLTGVTSYTGPLSGKRLELLMEIVPGINRVLAVVTRGDSIAEISFQFLEETAKKMGVQVIRQEVTTKEEIEKALRGTPRGSVDAIFHIPTSLTGSHIHLFIKKSKEDRIPLVVTQRSWVEEGALVSYGLDFRLHGIQAAGVVAKVLRGARPSEIRIETPDKLHLAINLATARALGLKIPPSVLERADHVTE